MGPGRINGNIFFLLIVFSSLAEAGVGRFFGHCISRLSGVKIAISDTGAGVTDPLSAMKLENFGTDAVSRERAYQGYLALIVKRNSPEEIARAAPVLLQLENYEGYAKFLGLVHNDQLSNNARFGLQNIAHSLDQLKASTDAHTSREAQRVDQEINSFSAEQRVRMGLPSIEKVMAELPVDKHAEALRRLEDRRDKDPTVAAYFARHPEQMDRLGPIAEHLPLFAQARLSPDISGTERTALGKKSADYFRSTETMALEIARAKIKPDQALEFFVDELEKYNAVMSTQPENYNLAAEHFRNAVAAFSVLIAARHADLEHANDLVAALVEIRQNAVANFESNQEYGYQGRTGFDLLLLKELMAQFTDKSKYVDAIKMIDGHGPLPMGIVQPQLALIVKVVPELATWATKIQTRLANETLDPLGAIDARKEYTQWLWNIRPSQLQIMAITL
jgi:hypothetical protein